MLNLNEIAEKIHRNFESQTRVRDKALGQARLLTRHAAQAIRAIHRSEEDLANENLNEAGALVEGLKTDLSSLPDIYYAGYTQDAIKEFVEASITVAIILNREIPTPESLDVEDATYLNGLAEVSGELRRRCLDILRLGYSEEAERLLACMDDIYNLLVTIDYPDAITHGLRRQTDLVRGIVERTRGDLTLSLREEQLKRVLEETSERFKPLLSRHAND
ncbi:MAG: haloacid dehalogenase [Anaerolineae bacterium]|nr:haloacid dehalogenase [Anaerolineae bacterium]